MTNPPNRRQGLIPTAENRHTAATRHRIRTTIILVEELKVRPMSLIEICEFLNFSMSGTRKYVQDLKDAQAIYVEAYEGRQVKNLKWHISKDEKLVAKILSDLRNGASFIPRVDPISMHERSTELTKRTASGVRHVIDGASHTSPVRPHHVFRDSLTLAMFGNGPAKKVDYDTD